MNQRRSFKGFNNFPYKSHSPIYGPLAIEDSLALGGGLEGWEVRMIDDVYLL